MLSFKAYYTLYYIN
ncbi:hypothetical protein CGLO_15873 [Colletotrichum gloeosporioides Cg-14]|uniref:Uncharacterized protein n=1 Tax=Colletotrichum gloeosporioides (strain Cg-14) TaxID=1237896 RepID=T0LAL0_COLGC|nr:hypothetical protein CGLO_15873 [Colletotrichum gloeosporioides Cg-14]